MRISDWSSDVCSSDLVAQGLDDRQASAHRGLVAELAAVVRGGADRLVALQRAAAGVLVGRDHVDARREPLGIAFGDRIAAAAVDDQRVRQVFGAERSEERRVGQEWVYV